MLNTKPVLLSSSPTFNGIVAKVTNYFFSKNIVTPIDETRWKICDPDGMALAHFQIRKVGSRYRFEQI